MDEAQWFEQVRMLLRLYGWDYYHTRDSRGSTAGFPDLVLARTTPAPQWLHVELKSARGQLSPAQRHWGAASIANGIPFYVWRPADLDAVMSVLTAHVREGA